MNNHIIIIAGGSFQGKSLLSLTLGSKLFFSGVLTTDLIRNTLSIQNPDKKYLGTSTYLLQDEDLAKQMDIVSDTIIKILSIYEKRGEKMIIEGMHFSDKFFRWTKQKGYCRICIDNQLAFTRRVELKSITRTNFRNKNGDIAHIDEFKNNLVTDSSYLKHKDRMVSIHQNILKNAKLNGYKVIKFNNWNHLVDDTYNYINQYLIQ